MCQCLCSLCIELLFQRIAAITKPSTLCLKLEVAGLLTQVVERVIALQFRQEGNPAHVLCLGYRQVSCFPHLIQSLASSTCAKDFGSIAVTLSMTEAWKLCSFDQHHQEGSKDQLPKV
jgi:hypothetical protein